MLRADARILPFRTRQPGTAEHEPRPHACAQEHRGHHGALRSGLGSISRQTFSRREALGLAAVSAVLTVWLTACGTALIADDFVTLVRVLGGALVGAAALGLGLAVAAFGAWCGGQQ